MNQQNQKLPSWLSDEGVRAFRVPEHLNKIAISGGLPITTEGIELSELLRIAAKKPDGLYYLVAEEGECPHEQVRTAHPSVCMACGAKDWGEGRPDGTIPQPRLIREDAEELEVGVVIFDGHIHEQDPGSKPDESGMKKLRKTLRSLLFLGKDGQRHEVKR